MLKNGYQDPYVTRRVAQAFKPAGVCNKWGAPSFAFYAKGGYHGGLQ